MMHLLGGAGFIRFFPVKVVSQDRLLTARDRPLTCTRLAASQAPATDDMRITCTRQSSIAQLGGCDLNLEGRQAIQHGIDMGRGGIWLERTEEKYAKLRKR